MKEMVDIKLWPFEDGAEGAFYMPNDDSIYLALDEQILKNSTDYFRPQHEPSLHNPEALGKLLIHETIHAAIFHTLSEKYNFWFVTAVSFAYDLIRERVDGLMLQPESNKEKIQEIITDNLETSKAFWRMWILLGKGSPFL